MKAKEPKQVLGEWQLCPKCNGQKLIWQLPGWPYNPTILSVSPVNCDICFGTGLIQRPIQIE